MTWPGANRRVHPVGLEAVTGVSNYLIGNDPARWRLGVPSFGRVRYHDLYPGIDLLFYGNQERLEYDFVVAPGGDPRAIRLRFSGEDAIRIDTQGDLVVRMGAAEFVHQAPVVYQEHEGTRQRVAGRYVKTNRHEVGFVVAPYDRARTLYIDPVLAFGTFLGGGGFDSATAVAVDSAGYAYVTGTTGRSTFPRPPASIARRAHVLDHSEDVFVTKISPTGALVYATYVGDDNTDDRGRGIAVDSAGNAYVTGETVLSRERCRLSHRRRVRPDDIADCQRWRDLVQVECYGRQPPLLDHPALGQCVCWVRRRGGRSQRVRGRADCRGAKLPGLA